MSQVRYIGDISSDLTMCVNASWNSTRSSLSDLELSLNRRCRSSATQGLTLVHF